MIFRLLLSLIFLLVGTAYAQEHFEWMLDFEEQNLYKIQRLSAQHLQSLRTESPGAKSKSTGTKIPGYKQFKRWEWFVESRVYPSGDLFNVVAKSWLEFHRYLQSEEYAKMRDLGLFGGSWVPIGPSRYNLGGSGYNGGLGRVNCVAMHPDGKNLYIGTPSSGLWQRSEAGEWSCLTDGLPLIGVSGIAIPTSESATIFILTGDGDGGNTNSIGVLKSADRGQSWSDTGLIWGVKQNIRGYKLAMSPHQESVLIAVTNAGLFKTADAGENWDFVAAGNFRDLEFHPQDENIAYASTINEVYRSDDGGETWAAVVSAQFPAGANRVALAVSPADAKVVYALFAGSRGYLGLYRSNDDGKSFIRRSNTPNLMGYSETGNDSSSQSWYDLALAVAPGDSNVVHLGGVNTWKSKDGGASWKITSHWIESNNSHGYTHADIHTLDYYGGRLYCGSDGGIYESTDKGENWQDLSPGLQIMQIYKIADTPQNPSLVYAGAQDNGSNRIIGDLGTHVFGADGGTCAIDYTNANVIYIATQNGGMRKSTDGGETFRSVKPLGSSSGAWVTPYLLHPKKHMTVYAGYTQLWKSTDGADTWKDISRGRIGSGTCQALAICEAKPNFIYVAKSTRLYRTTDDGGSWSEITGLLPVDQVNITAIAIHSENPEILWVTFSGYAEGHKVYQSSDAGNTWRNISGSLPNIPAHTIVCEKGPKNGVYVGMDSGVYYRNDDIEDWSPFTNGLTNTIVRDLKIHYGARKIRAGTFGRGLWESDLFGAGSVSRQRSKNEIQTSYLGDIDKLAEE